MIEILVLIFNFVTKQNYVIIGYETLFKHKMILDFASRFNLESATTQWEEGSGQPVCCTQLRTNSSNCVQTSSKR